MTIEDVRGSNEIQKELIDLVINESPARALKYAREAFDALPEAFTTMRDAINAASAALNGHMRVYDEFNRAYGDGLGVGVASLIRAVVGASARDLDDDRAFFNVVTEVGREKDLFCKLKSCVNIAKSLKESSDSWSSKLLKMEMRTPADGSSSAEFKVIQKKIIATKEIISRIKKRRDSISQIYFSVKKEIEKRVADLDAAFDPMFVNK